MLQYCGAGDDAAQCGALVDLAFATSFGTWQSSYANAWLQGGSYCTWPGVSCPAPLKPAVTGCCNTAANILIGSWPNGCAPWAGIYNPQTGSYVSPVTAVQGVNCSVLGYGVSPVYGGSAAVYNTSVTSLQFEYVGLAGTLPASFGSLSALTSLAITNEYGLYGTLPSSFAALTSLQQLDLENVMLNGTFDVLASLPSLTAVTFRNLRAVRGALPNFVSQNLQTMTVVGPTYINGLDVSCTPGGGADYTGNTVCSAMCEAPLPAWNLPRLNSLSMQNMCSTQYADGMGGGLRYVTPSNSLPARWSLPALTSLTLNNMPYVYGALPPATAFPALQSLSIQSCGLNASLPALPAGLTSISIQATPLAGDLSSMATSGFTSLTVLAINGASLTGTIPAALVPALNGLATCVLTGNGLQCPLPAGLTKLSCNPDSCVLSTQNALQYCGAGDDAAQCGALVDLAFATSFGTWQSSYANAWLQGGSYCTWPGVSCPAPLKPAVTGCCNTAANILIGSWPNGCAPWAGIYNPQTGSYVSPVTAVQGVNCSVLGYGVSPVYGGSAAVYNTSVTSLQFEYVGLAGTLPASFGSLSALTSLAITNEYGLYGTLPSSFAALTSLQQLDLENVMLNGTFDVLASLPSLTAVTFRNLRAVRGALPNFVSQNLQTMTVVGPTYINGLDVSCTPGGGADYTGNTVCSAMCEAPLPAWNLPRLNSLSMQNMCSTQYADGMGGGLRYVTPSNSLPARWSLPALTSLTLNNMPYVYGALPPATAFPALQSLSIQSCGLNASLPALPAGLTSISIQATPLAGDLSSMATSGFTSLTVLAINGASLTGTIPAALVPALNGLATCVLTGNGLQCPLPAGLTKLSCNPNSCGFAG